MTVFAKGSLIIPEKFVAKLALELMINEGVTTTFGLLHICNESWLWQVRTCD